LTATRGALLAATAAIVASASPAQDGVTQRSDEPVRALGRQLFSSAATPPCSICHTLKDASATGEIGPSLDQLRPDRDRVAKALRNGLGAMPSYRERLTEDQIEALATYVSQAVKTDLR
jgi:sulfite dehydrogenase